MASTATGDAPDGVLQAVRRVGGAAQDDAGGSGSQAVPRQRMDQEAGTAGAGRQLGVVQLPGAGEGDLKVQAGCDAVDARGRQVLLQVAVVGAVSSRWARVSCRRAGLLRSLACLAATTSACTCAGGMSQPMRMPGARVFDVLPVCATCSGADARAGPDGIAVVAVLGVVVVLDPGTPRCSPAWPR